jgi:hypothetical protein
MHAVFGRWEKWIFFLPRVLMMLICEKSKIKDDVEVLLFLLSVFGPINNDDIAGGSRLCFAYA